MSVAVIDAREWQNQFDLETGQKVEANGPVVNLVKQVLARHPYPGDMDARANVWVTQTALDLIEMYGPDLVCLSYVQQFFACRHFEYSAQEKDKMFKAAMDEAFRFVEISGYTPVVVGTGGMIPIRGEMDLYDLDGLAISSNWSGRYCGLHYPSRTDFDRIDALDGIERVVSRNELIDLFKRAQPDLDMGFDVEVALMPDYLLVAKQGYVFKTLGATLRKPVTVSENSFSVPVYTPLGEIKELRDIKPLIRSHLTGANGERHKIALILVEGVSESYFPDKRMPCTTGPDWYCYEPSDAFYLTLSTGKHQPFAYPAGYRYFDQDEEINKFPFSGYINRIPENTLGQGLSHKSIAVGNRSMFMHMVFGVDIGIECFARNLFNQGCLGVVHK